MNKAPDFASFAKDQFLEYIAFMVRIRDFRVPITILKAFDRFLVTHNYTVITTDNVTEFAYGSNNITTTQSHKRYDTVRLFVEHRSLIDGNIPIQKLPRCRTVSRHIPHWYTDEEINKILFAASQLTPHDTLRPHTYCTTIGLLACTGMRANEVMNLDVDDIDLANGIVRVREGKFRKSRLLPIHPSTLAILITYLDLRNYHFPNTKEPALFLNNKGVRQKYATFVAQYLDLARKTNVRNADGAGARIHDLRHTFAVKCISKWYDAGLDVNSMLPVLATYMGHAKFQDTAYYLNISAELLKKGAASFNLGGGTCE